MNLKLVLPKLSRTAIVLGLGFVLIPNAVKAANPVNATENLELSRPTLLVTKAEEVSVLVENAQTVPSQTPISVVENVDRNNYSIAKNQRLTSLFEEAKDNPPLANVKSLTTKKADSPTLVAQNFTNPPSQSASLPIAVELPSQPANNQYISIPIQVENQQDTIVNNSIAVNQSIPIPVVIPSSEVTTQQTETQISIETVKQPTLISNNPREFNDNSQSFNNRINPPESPRNNPNLAEKLVTAIPIEVEYYNPMVTPSAGQMVSPDLPEINSPDPFLPEGDRPFTGYIWPAKGVFTSGYGKRWGRMHKGIDIAAPVGTPIMAAADGEVISAGWNSGGFGNLVKIRHSDGTVTLYAHNSKIHVRQGQFVKQGQHISNMGSTGFSTGPHLHFEMHPQGQKAVNPIALLPKNRN